MSLPVIVLGAGGHAKVVIEALQQAQMEILGVTDPDPKLRGSNVLGVRILGDDEYLNHYQVDKICLVNGLGSVSKPFVRWRLFEEYKRRGFTFATVVHPSSVIAADVELGEGVQVMAGSVIQPGVRIGNNVIVNTKVSIDHDCQVENHVHLAPGVTLSGNVRVGEGVHIGTGASVVQNVSIERDCLIGAGSLVLKDIAEGLTAYGNPAEVVRK